MSSKRLLIRDLTLRDGQQSLFATRMRQEQVDKTLEYFKTANFYAMEVWGGAILDSVMRYLNEDPWDRLEKIHEIIGENSKLTALSRGRNLFGYSPYPDSALDGFYKNAVKSGVSIMRVFDALNDYNNVKSSIDYIKKYNGIVDCCVVYTVDSTPKNNSKILSLLHLTKKPVRIFSIDYFVKKAKQLEGMGADMITVKDMAGLVKPNYAELLIKRLKAETSLPIDFHTHCTPGYGLASSLVAIINGVDILDTSLLPFAGGTAAPAFEIIQLFCNKLNIDTGVNLESVTEITKILFEIRKELSEYDNYEAPRNFNIQKDKLPKDIDALFDEAISFAKAQKYDDLLKACHRIESWFGFPPPNLAVKKAEIPGGMYSNMVAQLKQLKMERVFDRALELIPNVRMDCGCPPLVTPTSQIVGTQAVNCAIDEAKGNPPYTTKTAQFINLVKGLYGQTPIEVDPEFRLKITGSREKESFSEADYKKPENPILDELGGLKLADNEKDELLLELFPMVAKDFLYKKAEKLYLEEIKAEEDKIREQILKEKEEYLNLTPEQKQERLLKGLYDYHWTSDDEDFSLGHS